jgi:mannosyl-oligosaccharide alpha-1,2-mannosidase
VPRAHVGTLLVVLALAAWTWDVLASFFVLRRSRNSYALRPDTVETFVYLWCLTRDSVWRERGWRIFEALQVRCRTNSGFASLKGHLREDSMPSYWLAETLKYLFLLFSDDAVLPLDQFVLNTEAHPLRIR